MERIGTPVEPQSRAHLGDLLGDLLVDLVSLALNGDQARRHVVGPCAPCVRDELERFATEAREWADRVADRAVILGFPVDGRPSAIGCARALNEFPFGLVRDREAPVELALQVSDVVVHARVTLEALTAVDPVSQHLVIEILESLERWLWRFQVDSAVPVGELRRLKPAGA
jgi:starvation-inducible DNA-binding protein